MFTHLPSGDLDRLLTNHRILGLAQGEHLFRTGDAASHLYVIMSGEVVLTPGSAPAKSATLRLCQGDALGEEAVLTRSPHSGSAVAELPSMVLAISAATLMGHLETHFETAITMISTQATALRERVREITELKMQSTAERLASFLLSLAGSAQGRTVVRLPYEKRHLADHLGMDPATLSRAFAKLRDKGVTASRTDKVNIEDVARLRRYGDGAAITH